MYRILAALVLTLAAAASEPGFRAQFVGGTVQGLALKSTARLYLTNPDTLFFACRDQIRIDYRKVNALEYGQNVSRRYAAAILISPVLLLSKSRRHYVTIGYVDAADRQQVLVLRIEKGDIRPVLAALEARTGRRVEYQDDEARKSGK